MKKFKLKNFTKGWIIGNFEPNIIKTDKFELAIKEYKKGDKGVAHFHKMADEISVIVSGIFKMNSTILKRGDIVWVKPGEIVDFFCIEDGFNAVVKIPSIKNDKYLK